MIRTEDIKQKNNKTTLLREYIEELIHKTLLNELYGSLEEVSPPPIPQAAIDQSKALKQSTDSNQPPVQNQLTGDLIKDSEILLKTNKDKLAKKGIDVNQVKKLGSGTMGVAYDIGNGKVLKITNDPREAKASGILVGKDIPNIVKIYDLWKFPNANYYGIIIEKLLPFDDNEAKQVTYLIQQLGIKSKQEADYLGIDQKYFATGFPGLLAASDGSFTKAQLLLAKLLAKRFYGQPNAEQLKNEAIQRFQALMNQYKMVDLFRSLKALGIKFFDFHGGNMGKRSDGSLVLFDLGGGISQGNLPQDLQEQYKNYKIPSLLD